MARPVKWRKIEHIPKVPYFVPSEKNIDEIAGNILKLEELEAVRLKDLEGLDQEECAAKMEVSRPTFQRILIAAREKIADSLVNGKTLQIEGGNFTRNICPVRCANCGKEWSESLEHIEMIRRGEYSCPSCGSDKVDCIKMCGERLCGNHCRRKCGID